MIADGVTINCLGKFHNINLTMGEYVLNSPMIAILMGGVGVVLWFQWLQSLGTVALNFQKLFMKFSWEGKEFGVNGITRKQRKVINSNGMKTLLKKGKQGVNTQVYSLDVQTCKAPISPDFQRVLKNTSKVFEDIPISHPHIR